MNVSTNFLNSKMRRIFVSAAGKYFAKSDDGKRTYKPKAAYRKVGADGSMNKLKKTNVVPTPIRPSAIAGRKTRKNAGGMRMTEAKAFRMVFTGNSAKKVRKVQSRNYIHIGTCSITAFSGKENFLRNKVAPTPELQYSKGYPQQQGN
jgi:hypothetical protein